MRVPVERFGKDHWSTFVYLETVVVDRRGLVENVRMRTSHKRHPLFVHPRNIIDGGQYPTRIKGGEEVQEHDDWDCLLDLSEAGLLRILSPVSPTLWQVEVGRRGPITVTNRKPTKPCVEVRVLLTGRGWEIAGKLREHIGAKRPVRDFEVGS